MYVSCQLVEQSFKTFLRDRNNKIKRIHHRALRLSHQPHERCQDHTVPSSPLPRHFGNIILSDDMLAHGVLFPFLLEVSPAGLSAQVRYNRDDA